MGVIETRLKELGLRLPAAAAPLANYVPFVLTRGNLIVSGQLPLADTGGVDPGHLGKVGRSVTRELGSEAARRCALNLLAQAKAALGNLDRIERCVRLGGFINADPEFADLAAVMNGASDLIVSVLGDKGRHARTTVGVASLPLGCAVEVEGAFSVGE